MATFTVNAGRLDPYKNFRFKVLWDNKPVAAVSKISALKRSTEVVEYRSGGDPATVFRSPGQTKYEPITLERGVTHDPEFEAWARKVGPQVSLKDFRKDIRIELYNEGGQLVHAYNVFRCWVSEYQALPELDASGNAVAIQTLKLENEGWEADIATTEPSEPVL
jgi:phage tail-like protein